MTQQRRCHVSLRPLPRPLAAASNEGGSTSGKPRRRSSSQNPSNGGGDTQAPPSPATQLANNLAAGGNTSPSSSSSSSSSSNPSPAAQVASNLASGGSGAGTSPPSTSPAAQVASTLSGQQQQQQEGPGAARGSTAPPSPVELLQQGIRAAANTAEEVITQGAAAATGGIEAATSLSQQGLSAAEAAAEDAARGLNAAAQGTLNAAAAAVGGAAGAVDGVAGSAAAGSSSSSSGRAARGGAGATPRGSSGGGSLSSSDFETVNVRVPTPAWANATPQKGRVRDATLTQDFDEDEVEGYKVQILAAVASLDRGLAANVREARDVDTLARKLEDAAGPITLRWATSRSSPDKSTMDMLAGTWRLIYSSGFNGGSLGGSRPGPPAAFVPTVLGQVYQVIDAQAMLLDNVVELLLSYGLPRVPFLSPPEPEATPGLRLTLHHTYEVTPPNSVKIVFESTAAKAIGPDILQGLPELGVPELPSFLKPPKDFRSATFNVTYLDASMRVTRGDRGELRMYLRDRPLRRSLPDGDADRDYD